MELTASPVVRWWPPLLHVAGYTNLAFGHWNEPRFMLGYFLLLFSIVTEVLLKKFYPKP